MIQYFGSFFVAALITAILTPIAIRIAPRIGAMDVPKDERRMHDHPIPRFGGPGIFIGMLLSVLIFVSGHETVDKSQLAGFLVGAAMIVVLGLIDDLHPMRARTKLLGQIICAIVPCMFSIRIYAISNYLRIGDDAYFEFPFVISVIVTIFWIVGITNTINLIDGLDGLAAGVSCISCIAVAYTSYLAKRPETCTLVLAIAGAAFGFLLWNFHPAKIFMGDSGSMLLGYCLATMSLIGVSSTKGTVLFVSIIPLIILALPILDTSFAIVRRVANHRPIMSPDKGHIHHRLMAMGFGQRRTVIVLYCIAAIMGVAGILWTLHLRPQALILALIGCTLVWVFLGIGIHDDTASAAVESTASIIDTPVETSDTDAPAEDTEN